MSMICNQAGCIDRCKTCPFTKPRATFMPCPKGILNYGITKFIGYLKEKDGQYYVKFNGTKLPGLIPDKKLTVPTQVNKRLVFWVTEGGIVPHRKLMRLQKTH